MVDIQPERPTAYAVLICHGADCENQGIPLELLHDIEDGQAVCGPCGRFITDITPVEPQPPTETAPAE